MDLTTFLIENNIKILDSWIDRVLATYAPESRSLFKRGSDQFANPVGYNVAQGLRDFYKTFCDEEDPAKAAATLDQLVRIRAVQDFSPAQALSFIFEFKQIVAEEYQKAKGVTFVPAEWLAFAGRIDIVALMVFDMYLDCRERLYKARINEIQSGRHILTDGSQCSSALLRSRRERDKDGSKE
jgi:hypothetical protein